MSEVYRPARRGNTTEKKIINFENVELRFKNFSGAPTKFDSVGGKRTFCVELDMETADALSEKGWNVKVTKPKNDDYEPIPYLPVKVSFRFKAPTVLLIQGRKRIQLTEENIGTLDWADIDNVDLSVAASNYEVGGRTGVSIYLQSMYVTLKEDAFAEKYSQYAEDIDDCDDVPFE